MSRTHDRRRLIQTLLAERELHSQKELRTALARRGFRVSQPVLSRDLRALKVAKSGGAYRVIEQERVTPLEGLKTLLRGVEPATHFAIVFCEPGAGSAVARALDQAETEGLVGTVAGDDTVLVALDSADAARRVRRLVTDLVSSSSLAGV
jgi:transcriptional regulator of arginine metabolism